MFTVPYFPLRSSRVEADGEKGGGGGLNRRGKKARKTDFSPPPTPTPLVDLILFSWLNSAHPFETKMAARNHLEDQTENNRKMIDSLTSTY